MSAPAFEILDWLRLDAAARRAALARPASSANDIEGVVARIIDRVRTGGDAALVPSL